MSFLLKCPNCGARNVSEFRFGGEATVRPSPDASDDDWSRFFYLKKNAAGVQQEWWNHRFGCRKWFFAMRDTVTNQVEQTFWT